MAKHLNIFIAVLLTAVLLAGCGGQDTPVEEAGVEEVVQEPTRTFLH